MPSPEARRFPDWAERERGSDIGWINENWHVFWPASQRGYDACGRGALVVDTRTVVVHEGGAGSPFGYVPQEVADREGWQELTEMLAAYDPARELVAVLLKAGARQSAYRLQERPADL